MRRPHKASPRFPTDTFQARLLEPFHGRMLKYVEFAVISCLKVGFYDGS